MASISKVIGLEHRQLCTGELTTDGSIANSQGLLVVWKKCPDLILTKANGSLGGALWSSSSGTNGTFSLNAETVAAKLSLANRRVRNKLQNQRLEPSHRNARIAVTNRLLHLNKFKRLREYTFNDQRSLFSGTARAQRSIDCSFVFTVPQWLDLLRAQPTASALTTATRQRVGLTVSSRNLKSAISRRFEPVGVAIY